MNQDHDSYRPRSPDLPTYKPEPPPLASYDASSQSGYPAGYPLTHRASFDASPYFSPQIATPSQSYFPQQPQLVSYSPQSFGPPTQPFSPQSISHAPPSQRIPKQSFSHPPPSFSDPPPDFFSTTHTMPRKRESDEEDDSYAPQTSGPAGRRKKQRPDTPAQVIASRAGAGPSLGIDVKTKFPVARIKRIMQADEDVGKVAQATPTAVCKLHLSFRRSLSLR